MGLEETHLDVLQNIEFSIVSVYRDQPDLSDYSVMEGLEALIAEYRAESRSHELKQVSLQGDPRTVHDRARAACEWRMGRAASPDGSFLPTPGIIPLDEMLSCLRKIAKSVQWWNRQGGPQGYLRFVSEYVK